MRTVTILTSVLMILSLSREANTSWAKISGLFDSVSEMLTIKEKSPKPVEELTDNSDEWTVISQGSPSDHENKKEFLDERRSRVENWIPEGDWSINASEEKIVQEWCKEENQPRWTPNHDSGSDSADEEGDFLEVDIQDLMKLTGASRRKVIQAFRSTDYVISNAIIELTLVGRSTNT